MAANTPELTINFIPETDDGAGLLTVTLGSTAVYTGPATFTDPAERERLLRAICDGRAGVSADVVAQKLEHLAADFAGSLAEPQRRSQAQLLVELADDAELFHDVENIAFATVPVNGHRETYRVNGKSFRLWLGRQLWQHSKKAAGSQAMQDAIAVLSGKAAYDGGCHEVHVRIARCDGAIYLDLANDKWQAVKITGDGWSVVDNPPVKFVRRAGMHALLIPVPGGSINELRRLLNIPDDGQWTLAAMWAVGSLHPRGPYPILVVNGEQGSAKSTTCKMLRRLIDPNQADLRAAPKDDRDLIIAANNSWVVGFDNLSSIPGSLSDSLCRIATGAGFATRELYTDDGEKLFQVSRPVIFNGIEELATRPDLLERSIILMLPTIPETYRRSEAELWREYELARPRILGALLDAAAAAMHNLPSVKLTSRPRMADFAEWGVAAEPALPFAPGAFLAAYTGNRQSATDLAIEASVVATAVIALVDAQANWSGTVKELLDELTNRYTDQTTRRLKEWPMKPNMLSNKLRRVAPVLRQGGVKVTFGKHTRVGTPVTLEREGKTSSPPSPGLAVAHTAVGAGDDRDDGDDLYPAGLEVFDQ